MPKFNSETGRIAGQKSKRSKAVGHANRKELFNLGLEQLEKLVQGKLSKGQRIEIVKICFAHSLPRMVAQDVSLHVDATPLEWMQTAQAIEDIPEAQIQEAVIQQITQGAEDEDETD